jgi:hypothetical protein
MPPASSPPPAAAQPRPLAALHAHFLAKLPRIEAHARVCFRHIRCPGKRDDAVAEVVALCWKWYVRLAQRGRDASQFASALATFAARHVRCGRRLCGQEPGQDALSPLAQRRHGFTVRALPSCESGAAENLVLEALADSAATPPPDAAAFRIDFPDWLCRLSPRDREVALDMALAHSTTEVAAKHGLSPGRISQLRRQFHADWQRFTDAPPLAVPA